MAGFPPWDDLITGRYQLCPVHREGSKDEGSMIEKAATGKLGTFDVTSLVVGSIIGADIYLATAISSWLVGPASSPRSSPSPSPTA